MHKQRLSFARLQNTQIFLLLLGDIKVQIKKCTKVFSAAPVKCLFSLEFIWLSISSFWFSKNQRSQFHHNTFSKIYSAMEGLGICLPYIKKCFQEHQWSAFLFMGQITQILLFLGMLLFERLKITVCERNFFFSIWVFFHEHSRTTRLQGKGEGIYLAPHYHFHPLHRHLDINMAITAGSSPLRIASSRTPTGNLWFSSASR